MVAEFSSTRLKREDCKRTKHDSNFSKWEILVAPSDWEDYSSGKEGAERYRIHNLPKVSGPGLYELGIAVSSSGLGREIAKLDADWIVVVYLGEADNVRTRLQHYGRSGSHLGNGYLCFVGCKVVPLEKGPGLFQEMFTRGYSIVYRWAPMKNKRDAQMTEAQLLKTFDYAWNTSGSFCHLDRSSWASKLKQASEFQQKTNQVNMVRRVAVSSLAFSTSADLGLD